MVLHRPLSYQHACIHLHPGRPSRTPLRPTSSLIKPPFNVVITGGTKGVGKALASEFLAAGDSVALCARSGELRKGGASRIGIFQEPQGCCNSILYYTPLYAAEAVDATVEELRSKGRVVGRACDVARAADVEAFTSFAQQGDTRLGARVGMPWRGLSALHCRQSMLVLRQGPGNCFPSAMACLPILLCPHLACRAGASGHVDQQCWDQRLPLWCAGGPTARGPGGHPDDKCAGGHAWLQSGKD